jgi:hypothetical protein
MMGTRRRSTGTNATAGEMREGLTRGTPGGELSAGGEGEVGRRETLWLGYASKRVSVVTTPIGSRSLQTLGTGILLADYFT